MGDLAASEGAGENALESAGLDIPDGAPVFF